MSRRFPWFLIGAPMLAVWIFTGWNNGFLPGQDRAESRACQTAAHPERLIGCNR